MTTTISRLKSLSVKKNIRDFEHLEAYVFTYCGATLREAVVKHEHAMRDFFDAKSVSDERPYIYRKPHRSRRPRLSDH